MTPQQREAMLLARFWGEVERGGDRIALLQRFAQAVVVRGPDWSQSRVREALAGFTLAAEACFCCRSRERVLYTHHVIQVQHGGGNHTANLVSLCRECHRRVHPWIDEGDTLERRRGFHALRDYLPRAWKRLVERLRQGGKRGEV